MKKAAAKLQKDRRDKEEQMRKVLERRRKIDEERYGDTAVFPVHVSPTNPIENRSCSHIYLDCVIMHFLFLS